MIGVGHQVVVLVALLAVGLVRVRVRVRLRTLDCVSDCVMLR